MYWYFQQNQCLNIKKHAVYNIHRLAWDPYDRWTPFFDRRQYYMRGVRLVFGLKCWYLSTKTYDEPSWPWSYGSWIYNYLCNQCLSLLMLWVRISIRARCTTLCDKVCDLRQVGGFLRVIQFPPPIKLMI